MFMGARKDEGRDRKSPFRPNCKRSETIIALSFRGHFTSSLRFRLRRFEFHLQGLFQGKERCLGRLKYLLFCHSQRVKRGALKIDEIVLRVFENMANF